MENQENVYKNAKVSYLIPSYNHKKYIKKAIDSVLAQTYSNIELIVCDDCSTDGTVEFLDKYSKERDFIFYENAYNIGASQTTQRLIELASGDYLCMLASDDWIAEDKVQKQLSYMQIHKLDGLFGPVIKYLEEEKRFEEQSTDDIEKIVNSGKTLENIYKTGNGGGLIQSGMFRTDVVKTIGFLKNYKSDDFLFQLRFLQAGYKLGYLNDALTFYRIHLGNSHSDIKYCLEELELPVIRDFIPKKYQKRRIAGAYASAAVKALSYGNLRLSLELQRVSLKNHIDLKTCMLFAEKNLRYFLIKIKLYPYIYRIVYRKEWNSDSRM